MIKKIGVELKEESINLSSILETFNKYQAWQFFLTCLTEIFVSMLSVNFVFVAGNVNHRCRVSECESTNADYSPAWWPDAHIDSCYKPVLNNTLLGLQSVCTNESFTRELEVCTEWVYENNDTIVADLNLACQQWKVNLVGTLRGVGMIVAMLSSGWMCDRFGRKPTLIVASVGCVLGNLKVLTKSYNIYMFLEFLESAVSTGAYTAGAVLMAENSGSRTRIMAGVIFAYAIYMGEALFAIIAMYVPNWKNLLMIICSPPALSISYIFLLNESPRWQILNGKVAEAKKTLKTITKTNQLKIDSREIDNVSEDELKKMFNLSNVGKRESFKKVFQSGEIRKRLAGGILWRLAASFIYYSLVINSVFLPGDKYVAFLLTALTSFPGEILSMYLLNKIGRRVPLMSGFLLCGLTCIASAYVPESNRWIKIVLFLLGKLIVSACYTGTVVYTMELFPTSVRGSCIGICTLASCAGSMLAPLTPALTFISPVLSSFCFAFIAVLATVMVTLTPETKDRPLTDTIDQITSNMIKEKQLKQKKKEETLNTTAQNDDHGNTTNYI